MAIMPPATVSAPLKLSVRISVRSEKALTFNQEQILPPLERRLDLEDPKRNQTCERTRHLTGCIEDTQSSCKFIPLVERCEIEDHTRIESRLRHTKKPSRGDNSAKIDGSCTNHCHGAEDHHCNWKDEFGSKFLREHVHWWS